MMQDLWIYNIFAPSFKVAVYPQNLKNEFI